MTERRQSNGIHDMFDHIVESPFYSATFDGEVRIDDFSNVYVDGEFVRTLTKRDDDLIETLFHEWVLDPNDTMVGL